MRSFRWDGPHDDQPDPYERPEFATFAAKTAAALAEQVAIARAARQFVGHRVCSDTGACRHCAAVRNAHTSINDHLDQLEVARLEEQASA